MENAAPVIQLPFFHRLAFSPYESVQSGFVNLDTSVRCREFDGVSKEGPKAADQVVEEGAHLYRLQSEVEPLAQFRLLSPRYF